MATQQLLYHRFKAELTVYSPEARFFSNAKLKEYEADPNGGKRDVFQDDKDNCTKQGGRVNDKGEPKQPQRVQGVSLFWFSVNQGKTDEAYKYAHEHILGQTKVEKLRQRQREINLMESPDQRDEAQKILDLEIVSEIPKCFTCMSDQFDNNEVGLYTDRVIKDQPSGDELCSHTYLYPATEIPVAEMRRYALCEKPENGWMVCTYRFSANAESIDLPDVPDGDVDAACLLLQCLISSSSIATEERFLAAWLQYFIAYHWETYHGHPNQIVSIGNGIVAELFVKAAELRAQQNSVPYPTPELDGLITCANYFIQLIQPLKEQIQLLLILHFKAICLKGEGVSVNESCAIESLRECTKDRLTSWGHEIPYMEVCAQNSLMLSCFCFPPVTEEEISKLVTNPLQHGVWTFALDGTNRHVEKPIDFIQLDDDKVGDEKGVKDAEEKVVEDICLRVELLKLNECCPESCGGRHIPDRLYKISVQCNGKTKKGKQCRNKTLDAIGLCYLHKDQKECGYY